MFLLLIFCYYEVSNYGRVSGLEWVSRSENLRRARENLRVTPGNVKDIYEVLFPGVHTDKIRHLYLWTKRGCARHAKILTTEKAWQVFEEFEDAYVRILLSFDNLREG